MTQYTHTEAGCRELAHRVGEGIEVTLQWAPIDNRLTVSVTDWRSGESFELDAHPENALDVFYHPYAYAAFLGIGYEWTEVEAVAA